MSRPPLAAFETLFKAAKQKQGDNKKPPTVVQGSHKNLLPPITQSIKDGKSQYEKDQYMGVNQVLYYQFKAENTVNKSFYVPCYLRLKVNRVSEINYIEGSAAIQTELRIWLMLKQFPPAVQEQIINLAKLQINGGETSHTFAEIPEPPKLDGSYKKNISKKAIGFLVVEEMKLDIECNPFWSPFELVKLVANLEIKKINLGDHQPEFYTKISDPSLQELYKGASIQFNFMDAHPFLNFSFGQVNHLGSFDIAQSLVDMEFSNEAIKGDDDDDDSEHQYSEVQEAQPLNLGELMGNVLQNQIGLKEKVYKEKLKKGLVTPDAYQHGKILIPLYKYPAMTLINVFVPFYMVAILNLGVFFEANDMSNRSASLATFQLAYIAFFPTIRQTLPQTPKLVFAEILIYIQALCTLICFFYSLEVNMKEDYVFTWYTDPVFLVCLALTVINLGTIVTMMILHKCRWEPEYNKLPDGAIEYMETPTLDTDDPSEWWNQRCQSQFKSPMQLNLVKPAFPHKLKKKKKSVLGIVYAGKKDEERKIHPQ